MSSSLFKAKRDWQIDSSNPKLCTRYFNELQRTGITTLDITEYPHEALLRAAWPNISYKGMNGLELLKKIDEFGSDHREKGNLVLLSYRRNPMSPDSHWGFIAVFNYDNRRGFFCKTFELKLPEKKDWLEFTWLRNYESYFFEEKEHYKSFKELWPHAIEIWSD